MHHGMIKNLELIATLGWATIFMVLAILALFLMEII